MHRPFFAPFWRATYQYEPDTTLSAARMLITLYRSVIKVLLNNPKMRLWVSVEREGSMLKKVQSGVAPTHG